MDWQALRDYTKVSKFTETPTEDILSHLLFLASEPSNVIEKVLQSFKQPVSHNLSIDIDDLIAEYKNSDLSNETIQPNLKRFTSLEELSVGACNTDVKCSSCNGSGKKCGSCSDPYKRCAKCKTCKKCNNYRGKKSDSETSLVYGGAAQGVSINELSNFLKDLGAANPTLSAKLIKKVVESIKRNLPVAARLEELDWDSEIAIDPTKKKKFCGCKKQINHRLKRCSICTKNELLQYFLNEFENEQVKSYISFALRITNDPPFENHSKRILARYYGITEAHKAKLKEITKDNLNRDLHKILVIFGKETCKDKDPSCTTCPLNSTCKYFSTTVVN